MGNLDHDFPMMEAASHEVRCFTSKNGDVSWLTGRLSDGIPVFPSILCLFVYIYIQLYYNIYMIIYMCVCECSMTIINVYRIPQLFMGNSYS